MANGKPDFSKEVKYNNKSYKICVFVENTDYSVHVCSDDNFSFTPVIFNSVDKIKFDNAQSKEKEINIFVEWAETFPFNSGINWYDDYKKNVSHLNKQDENYFFEHLTFCVEEQIKNGLIKNNTTNLTQASN